MSEAGELRRDGTERGRTYRAAARAALVMILAACGSEPPSLHRADASADARRPAIPGVEDAAGIDGAAAWEASLPDGGGPDPRDAARDAIEAAAPSCDAGTARLLADVQPILNAHCSGTDCHVNATNVADGMDLSSGKAYASLLAIDSAQCAALNMTRTRVAAGNPGASYLLNKLAGVDMCSGVRMPKNAAPLSTAEIQTVASWICRGAKND